VQTLDVLGQAPLINDSSFKTSLAESGSS
jgi:hypothetical protein